MQFTHTPSPATSRSSLGRGKRGRFVFTGALLLAATASARGYSPPPSWDPMLMLNVTLNASNQLAVETTPYLIRLLIPPGVYDVTNQIYNLGFITFDPAQPYAVLNGTAYSRVLGWYDEGTTGFNGDDFYDTYAPQLHGTNYVWIEHLGGSPGLKTYFINEDVAGDPATPYTPIFGTDGSPAKWRWDGKMDHNAYAVDLRRINTSNQLFTATYHLYIGDAAGHTNHSFGQTTTTWRWQGPVVPVIPSPRLTLTNSQVLLTWPPTVTNLNLLAAPTADAVDWITVTNPCFSSNGLTGVQLAPTNPQQYFRLRLTP